MTIFEREDGMTGGMTNEEIARMVGWLGETEEILSRREAGLELEIEEISLGMERDIEIDHGKEGLEDETSARLTFR